MHIESSPEARTRRPHRLGGTLRLLAALTAALGAGVGVALAGAAPSASAAPWDGTQWAHAYGRYVTYTDGETIWRGSEWIDGMQAYCLEPRWHSPDAGDSATIGTWQPGTFYAEGSSAAGVTVTAAQAQAINWLVATHGQLPDDQNSLNVASAIRTFLHAADGNGDAPGTNLYRNAQPYLDLLRGYVPPAGPAATQEVGLALSTDPSDAYRGTLTVTSAPITTVPVTITLTNAVFASDGAASLTLPSLSPGVAFPILGTPPAADGAPYRVGAALVGNGTLAAEAYPDTLLMATHDAVHQELVLPQPPATVAVALQGGVEDAAPRPSGFFPTVTTLVDAATVSRGEPLRDTVRVATGTSEDGLQHAWPRDPMSGGYRPVVVDCAVYGPFATPPARQASVPTDAPLATTFTVTTGAEGPDAGYGGVSTAALADAGYYSTVCTIDAAAQPMPSAVSAGYRFSDDFGQATETVHVPMPPAPAQPLPAPPAPAMLAATGPSGLPLVTLLLALAAITIGLLLLAMGIARRPGRIRD